MMRRQLRTRIWVFCSAFCLVPSAFCAAEANWALTTADFQTKNVDLRGIGADGVTVADEKGQTQVVPMGQFLQLSRPGVEAARVKAKFVLVLASGDTVAGEPAGVKDEVLAWHAGDLGELRFPLRQVTAIRRPGVAAGAGQSQEPQTEDVVRLANGDAVKGIVAAIEPGTVSVQVGNDLTPVPADAITGITFASVGGAKPKGEAKGFRVRLADGSSLVVPGLTWESGSVTLQVGSDKRRLDGSKLAMIEQVNGPVAWLSAIEPAENVQTPYVGQPWPARMDRSVSGGPLRAGGKTFARGIGVHAYSRLAWDLDGSYKAFRTQYAVDGDRDQADATVRIKLDDKVVHEKQHVRAGELAEPVSVELGGAKRLTLEVDFGENYDVQDRVDWLEPALVR